MNSVPLTASVLAPLQPPRLPRAASKMNCVQSRSSLSRLLRWQMGGGNPVYGSPDTRPPWWPEESLRWCDVVDLRGKPPYLPDQKSYTDVLRQAVVNALKYYGKDPENYLEGWDDDGGRTGGLSSDPLPLHLRPEVTAAAVSSSSSAAGDSPAAPPPPPSPPPLEVEVEPMGEEEEEEEGEHIMVTPPVPIAALTAGGAITRPPQVRSPPEGPPPRLPIPIRNMNCGNIRVCLSKLLWHNNRNHPPVYGSPLSMPEWWPNHLMDWTRLKNLRHRYEGPLGSTYTNCLRTALVRGYAFYGLDPNEYVEHKSPAAAAAAAR